VQSGGGHWSEPARASPHPVVWFALYLPFGILGRLYAVTLVFLLHAAASTVTRRRRWWRPRRVLPNTWRWPGRRWSTSPSSAKAWFVISVLATAATTLALA